jgi:lysophospholipase L1-like esterase
LTGNAWRTRAAIKRALFAAAAVGGVVMIAAIAGELAFGRWLDSQFARRWHEADGLNLVRNAVIAYDATAIYGADAPPVIYSRDGWGLRGTCRPEDATLLTLGGSTTDQRFIGDGQTWQDHLQRHWRAVDPAVCVTNAGVDGHTTFGHLLAVERWLPLIPGLRPRFVLLYVGINDVNAFLRRNEGFDYTSQPPLTLADRLRHQSFLYGVYGSVRRLREPEYRRALWAAGRHALGQTATPGLMPLSGRLVAGHGRVDLGDHAYVTAQVSSWLPPLAAENAGQFADRLRQLLDRIAGHGAQAICVSQPTQMSRRLADGAERGLAASGAYHGDRQLTGLDFAVAHRAINDAMRRVCRQHGASFIDLHGASFEAADYYDPLHMTPSGAAKVGEYLFRAFREQRVIGGV